MLTGMTRFCLLALELYSADSLFVKGLRLGIGVRSLVVFLCGKMCRRLLLHVLRLFERRVAFRSNFSGSCLLSRVHSLSRVLRMAALAFNVRLTLRLFIELLCTLVELLRVREILLGKREVRLPCGGGCLTISCGGKIFRLLTHSYFTCVPHSGAAFLCSIFRPF